MNLEYIILSETSHSEENKYYTESGLTVEVCFKNVKLIDAEDSTKAVTRAWGEGGMRRGR